MEMFEFVFLGAVGLVLAVALLWVMDRFLRPRPLADVAQPAPPRAMMLFQNGLLIDANAAGHALFLQPGDKTPDWHDVAQVLGARFADFPAVQGCCDAPTSRTLRARDDADPAMLILEQWDDRARITLQDPVDFVRAAPLPNAQPVNALSEAPYPIWQTDGENRVTWANAAYVKLAENLALERAGGELPVVFADGLPKGTNGPARTAVSNLTRNQSHWFDVTTVPGDGQTTHYATNANAIVNAEIAQRNFVQTLTKTFAQLSIGLAIFDRNRQLALFNPALIDLTALPADFLSSRPNLLTFFDRMRENRMMPEPRNYASWREQIAELVVAAADDRYTETWTLPSGVTYRVVGRPHPDGAIAFLFEDISAEVSLARKFRADLELGHSALNTIRDGMAVFSPTGNLGFCNAAFRDLWQVEPEAGLTDYTLQEAMAHWRQHSDKSDAWERLRHHVLDLNPRESWQEDIRMTSGQMLRLRVVSLSGGFTSILFEPLAPGTANTAGSTEMMAG